MRASGLGLSILLTALAIPAEAETSRVLRAELPADANPAAIENLAGTMRVVPGPGDRIVVQATVHAESAKLAEGFRLDREGNGATLRVGYPLDEVGTVRYPDPRRRRDGRDGWWNALDFGEGTTCDYGGRRVRVSHRHGTLLYADVEIQVPRSRIRAAFRNWIGYLEADQAEGSLEFQVRSADLRLDRLTGETRVEGTSGDIHASRIRGSWESKFTSGDCDLDGFEGESFDFAATSGDLRARDVQAARFRSRTTSGDVRLSDARLAEISAEATSGDISIEELGAGLARVVAETTSGDVVLRLPRDSSFDAKIDHGSGDVRVNFSEAFEQRSGGRHEHYVLGKGAIRIDARTGSGDLTISPGR